MFDLAYSAADSTGKASFFIAEQFFACSGLPLYFNSAGKFG